MTVDTAASAPAATARNVMDRIRYMVLGTIAPQRGSTPRSKQWGSPRTPLPYWGWGAIPDQYGRDFDGNDGDTARPLNPELTDLPLLRPPCGPRGPRRR
jgi:hypothetical protein